MQVVRYVPLMLLALGAALLVDAVLRGNAHAALVLIVPVLTGSSLEFLLGVLLLFVGLLALPVLSVTAFMESSGNRTSPDAEEPSVGSGGVLLVGPVPIFFGDWAEMRRRTYWWWVAVASVLFAAFLVGWVWLALAG